MRLNISVFSQCISRLCTVHTENFSHSLCCLSRKNIARDDFLDDFTRKCVCRIYSAHIRYSSRHIKRPDGVSTRVLLSVECGKRRGRYPP
jgi:hypothetical protein